MLLSVDDAVAYNNAYILSFTSTGTAYGCPFNTAAHFNAVAHFNAAAVCGAARRIANTLYRSEI
jgi:hypothetical protein